MKLSDVVLTDLGLVVLCALLAGLAWQTPVVGMLFAGFYAALGLAAWFGALWHGRYEGQGSHGVGGRLWLSVMVAVGLGNMALWLLVGVVWPAPALFAAIGLGLMLVYLALAVFVSRSFLLVSAFSLPPVLALLAGFGLALARGGPAGFWFGIAGLALALAGAGLQAARIAVPRLGLSHNGLYHLIQGAALVLLYLTLPALEAWYTKG